MDYNRPYQKMTPHRLTVSEKLYAHTKGSDLRKAEILVDHPLFQTYYTENIAPEHVYMLLCSLFLMELYGFPLEVTYQGIAGQAPLVHASDSVDRVYHVLDRALILFAGTFPLHYKSEVILLYQATKKALPLLGKEITPGLLTLWWTQAQKQHAHQRDSWVGITREIVQRVFWNQEEEKLRRVIEEERHKHMGNK